ncbi:MAG TPA: UDP-2,3-diacylglucosamine diphosphatase [bacterium]|jgi:UDP-2,3-diacylglucosamine pyrophosphatase LpxH
MTEGNRWEPTPGQGGPLPSSDALESLARTYIAAETAAPSDAPQADIRRYRAIWISDVHLGTRGCQAGPLLDFLRHTESGVLYLVGDIIDAWQMRKSWYWPDRHNEVVRLILRKARQGTKVIYVPGNHDEFFRDYTRLSLGGVTLLEDTVHTTRDGRRFLVIHGDVYDGVVTYARWLAYLGDTAYHWALRLNTLFNLARRKLGYPYWSLAAFLKHRVKNAVSFISNFESALAEEARERGLDGVICGHIHHAEMRDVDGVLYANDGDWVESCTALVEHDDGSLALLHWAEERGMDFHELNG